MMQVFGFGFLGGSEVKNPSAKAEDTGSIRCLGQEDSLEVEMATHSSILVWSVLWTEEPDGLQFTGSQKS